MTLHGESLIYIGRLFHKIVPVYLADLIPCWVVLTMPEQITFGSTLLLLSLRTEVEQAPIVFIGFGICP